MRIPAAPPGWHPTRHDRAPRSAIAHFGVLLFVAGATFAPAAASAAPFFDVAAGDWFAGASWSGGAIPTATDSPVIDNGGTATAADASLRNQSLAIGSRLDAARPADASGRLELTRADLQLSGDLSVAVVGVPDEPSFVTGSLAGAANAPGPTPGSVIAGGAVRVGALESAAAPGSSAFGNLELGGSLEASDHLAVGVADQAGTAGERSTSTETRSSTPTSPTSRSGPARRPRRSG